MHPSLQLRHHGLPYATEVKLHRLVRVSYISRASSLTRSRHNRSLVVSPRSPRYLILLTVYIEIEVLFNVSFQKTHLESF